MKTITKEINLLDIEDIEEALSAYCKRKISISEVGCTLVYCIPCDTREPSGMYLEFSVDEDAEWFESPTSFDVFCHEEFGSHFWKGKILALDEPWLEPEMIFAFPVSEFKSFDSYTDSSD